MAGWSLPSQPVSISASTARRPPGQRSLPVSAPAMSTSQSSPESQAVTQGLPMSSHTYTALLGLDEVRRVRTQAPPNFQDRAQRGAYTYVVFFARTTPLAALGISGDIWLCTTPGAEGIYLMNGENHWVPLGWSGTKATRQVQHPWLGGKRTLQFDGSKLGWFCSNEWLRSRSAWDEWLRLQAAVPPLPDMRVEWVARYLAQRTASATTRMTTEATGAVHLTPSPTSTSPSTAAPARGTEIPSESRPELATSAGPPSSSPGTSAAPLSSTHSSSVPKSKCRSKEAGASSSKENPPSSGPQRAPPRVVRTGPMAAGLPSNLRTMPLRNTTNAPSVRSIAPASGCTKKSSSTLLAAAAKPEPTVTRIPDSPTVIIKQEEDAPAPTRRKRPHVEDRSAFVDEASFKRVKTEEDDNGARELLKLESAPDEESESSVTADGKVTSSSAVQTVDEHDCEESVRAAAGRSSPTKTPHLSPVGSFLASLSVPLDHHSSLFHSLGITSLTYIEAVASMPQHVLNELIFALQDQGLSFVEAHILRDALDDLPVDRNSPRRCPRLTEGATPVRVDVFLDSLRPSMKHHTATFWQLGMYTSEHMSALGETEAHRYAEFERTLQHNGLTWMDCFIVRTAVQACR